MNTVRKGEPLVTVNYNLNEPALQMNLFHTGRKKFDMDSELIPKLAYSGQLGVDAKKYKDLEKWCKEGIIPKGYHGFYRDLTSRQEAATDDGSDSEYEDY